MKKVINIGVLASHLLLEFANYIGVRGVDNTAIQAEGLVRKPCASSLQRGLQNRLKALKVVRSRIDLLPNEVIGSLPTIRSEVLPEGFHLLFQPVAHRQSLCYCSGRKPVRNFQHRNHLQSVHVVPKGRHFASERRKSAAVFVFHTSNGSASIEQTRGHDRQSVHFGLAPSFRGPFDITLMLSLRDEDRYEDGCDRANSLHPCWPAACEHRSKPVPTTSSYQRDRGQNSSHKCSAKRMRPLRGFFRHSCLHRFGVPV